VHKCVTPFLFLDIVHCARGGRGRSRGKSEDAVTSVALRSHGGRGRGRSEDAVTSVAVRSHGGRK
jgi:hypothetical protein